MSTSKNKNTFTYSPSQADVDAYIKFKYGESKQKNGCAIPQKPYMKDYKALHHIDGLSDNSILVYQAIRNLVGMYVLQQKYKESYKKQKSGRAGSIGTVRNNTGNTSVVGTTMIITNPMLQEWIGNKSHNTIKSALEQLESMGFIKCSTDGVKKSGRKITLLRDMEEYQPEEIEALEAYLKALENVEDSSGMDVLPEDEKPKRKAKKSESKQKSESKKKNDEFDELDDFDF